jgi:hypothetical protein
MHYPDRSPGDCANGRLFIVFLRFFVSVNFIGQEHLLRLDPLVSLPLTSAFTDRMLSENTTFPAKLQTSSSQVRVTVAYAVTKCTL